MTSEKQIDFRDGCIMSCLQTRCISEMVVYYREMMPGCVTPLTGSVFGRAVDFATTVSP